MVTKNKIFHNKVNNSKLSIILAIDDVAVEIFIFEVEIYRIQ